MAPTRIDLFSEGGVKEYTSLEISFIKCVMIVHLIFLMYCKVIFAEYHYILVLVAFSNHSVILVQNQMLVLSSKLLPS